ncbi:hypothetical protein [Limnohabitans sp.]|jgi:hypothetical protein|uniref:hypothetical protein n=1 Tax=Limnohabitans sp. TaxID=1907725 RepID=UPI0037BF288F
MTPLQTHHPAEVQSEMAFDTTTLQQLKAQRGIRQDKLYVFRLDSAQVQRARELNLPDSALIALAAIEAAAYGVRRNDWITLPPRTIDAFARGFRWWHRATSKLEKVGLIECQRHTGKLPRYRLKKAGAGAPQKARRTIPIKSANERKQGPI